MSVGFVAAGKSRAAAFNGNVALQGGNVSVSGGNVTVNGDLTVTGKKSAAAAFPDGSRRLMYCVESPRAGSMTSASPSWMNGEAQATLDPSFVPVVSGEPNHVFISEYDEDHALCATNRTSTGFRVRSKSSSASGTFQLRVVAMRRDVTASRFTASPNAASS